jgi:hypothetical protein
MGSFNHHPVKNAHAVRARAASWRIRGSVCAGFLGLSIFLVNACSSKPELATSSCAPLSSACPANMPVPSFANDVTPILSAKCNVCHSPSVPDGPWPLISYDDVSAWSDVISSDLQGCMMPPADAGVDFTETERETINDWVTCGSPNN